MATITKNTLLTLTLPLLMTTLTTNGMEITPFKKTNNEITVVKCSAMIFKHPRDASVTYTFKKKHEDLFNYNNLQSNLEDPIIALKMDNTSENEGFLQLPAKQFFNLPDKSLLQIYEKNGSIISKNYGPKPILINALCQKNPKLDGDTFAEQFNNAMNKFYIAPSVEIDEKNQTELEDAGIIKINNEIQTSYPNVKFPTHPWSDRNSWKQIMNSRNSPSFFYVENNENMISHGPNGISNEKALVKSIINEKIPEKTSYFKALRNRELTGSFRKKI